MIRYSVTDKQSSLCSLLNSATPEPYHYIYYCSYPYFIILHHKEVSDKARRDMVYINWINFLISWFSKCGLYIVKTSFLYWHRLWKHPKSFHPFEHHNTIFHGICSIYILVSISSFSYLILLSDRRVLECPDNIKILIGHTFQ